MSVYTSATIKVVAPAVTIAVVLLVLRRRHVDLEHGVGLRRPPAIAAAWVVGYALLILGSNALMDWRGPWDFTVWRQSPLYVDACRVLGVVILGPVAEELLFRGALYERLLRTKLAPTRVIGILAAAWAAIHWEYSSGVIALLFVAGLLLGAARRQTGSVITPMLMHILWNLYAVW